MSLKHSSVKKFTWCRFFLIQDDICRYAYHLFLVLLWHAYCLQVHRRRGCLLVSCGSPRRLIASAECRGLVKSAKSKELLKLRCRWSKSPTIDYAWTFRLGTSCHARCYGLILDYLMIESIRPLSQLTWLFLKLHKPPIFLTTTSIKAQWLNRAKFITYYNNYLILSRIFPFPSKYIVGFVSWTQKGACLVRAFLLLFCCTRNAFSRIQVLLRRANAILLVSVEFYMR